MFVKKKTEDTKLCEELTTRRLQLLKIRKDATHNWVKFADSDCTLNIRLELKACDRRLRAIANDKRLAAEQNLNDLYEALSARPPEMAIVWRCARRQASRMLIPTNKILLQS